MSDPIYAKAEADYKEMEKQRDAIEEAMRGCAAFLGTYVKLQGELDEVKKVITTDRNYAYFGNIIHLSEDSYKILAHRFPDIDLRGAVIAADKHFLQTRPHLKSWYVPLCSYLKKISAENTKRSNVRAAC